jgi:hypothetical protein
MLNWQKRQKSSTIAAATAYPQPPLADWRNRKTSDIQRNPAARQDPVIRRNRKLKYLELFFFAVVISLIIGVDLSIFSINKRLNALEGELVEVKDWAFPASLLESKYTALNTRVRALNQALNGLDAKLTSVASQPAVTAAAGDEAITFTKASIPSEAPAAGITKPSAGIIPDTAGHDDLTTELTGLIAKRDDEGASAATQHQTVLSGLTDDATVTLHSVEEIPIEASMGEPDISSTPAPPVTATNANPLQASLKGGRWVINLLSDPNEALAERFAAKARDHGVSVEQNRTEVKGRVFWRVQLTGFQTASEARAHAEEIKAKLHLKNVWIFKEQG